ncbi:hypothetical protein [Gluconobacter cerinus]|uniref:Uncharacterized protein n=1 Tax=Gluconobacter cerinus TaxID=38307 RepID=A0A1B6VJP8_9PROT|nr:hypothetical protein [Gluconobacter cerinus]OAJ67449.1 hypothetical protein A0123_02048 [Gluconobacter cerinus]
MIVQETRIKTSSGHKAVSKHVLAGAKNEAIRILSGSDYLLKDWMKEARREGIHYGLRHIAFNPAVSVTDEQLASFAKRICAELSADPDRMTLVIHQKDGRTHGHLLLPEWQDDHVLSSRFSWQRLEKIARVEELRLGHSLVPGRHDHAIAKALRADGNHDAADRIAALAPQDGAARPVAAYTSQARRITERQDFDLPTARREILSFWQASDNDLTAFRNLLATKNWRMRSGDRTDGRRDAHIIETRDGMLIGSFTRLTKVRMKDFRELLEKEATIHAAIDLRPVARRLKRSDLRRQQRISVNQTEQDLLWTEPSLLSEQQKQRLAERAQAEVKAIQKHLPSIASPLDTEKLSEGFQIYLKDWKREMQAARAVLNAKHPLEKRYGPESPLDIQTHCIILMMQDGWKRLKHANHAVLQARKDLNDLEAQQWVFSRQKKISEAEKQLQQALAQLAEILRYVVEFILYHLGLSSRKPAPLQIPVPMEQEMSRQQYLENRQELLQTLLSEKTRRDWIKDRCREAEQQRARVIEKWHDERQPEKDQAEAHIATLLDVARSPKALPDTVRNTIRDLKQQGQLRQSLDAMAAFNKRDATAPVSHTPNSSRSIGRHHNPEP